MGQAATSALPNSDTNLQTSKSSFLSLACLNRISRRIGKAKAAGEDRLLQPLTTDLSWGNTSLGPSGITGHWLPCTERERSADGCALRGLTRTYFEQVPFSLLWLLCCKYPNLLSAELVLEQEKTEIRQVGEKMGNKPIPWVNLH